MKFWRREDKGRSTERRHRVKITRMERVRAAGGFTEVAAVDAGLFWASVEPLTERSRLDYQSVSVEATHRIVINGAINVAQGDMVELNGRSFMIKTVRREEERRRDQILITDEIVPGQKK